MVILSLNAYSVIYSSSPSMYNIYSIKIPLIFISAFVLAFYILSGTILPLCSLFCDIFTTLVILLTHIFSFISFFVISSIQRFSLHWIALDLYRILVINVFTDNNPWSNCLFLRITYIFNLNTRTLKFFTYENMYRCHSKNVTDFVWKHKCKVFLRS